MIAVENLPLIGSTTRIQARCQWNVERRLFERVKHLPSNARFGTEGVKKGPDRDLLVASLVGDYVTFSRRAERAVFGGRLVGPLIGWLCFVTTVSASRDVCPRTYCRYPSYHTNV